MEVYTNPLAFHPGKVSMMLAEKKIPHKSIKLDLLYGQNLEPSFIRMNPAAAVPVIRHNGQVIIGSKRICEYLNGLDGKPLGADKVDQKFVEGFVQMIDEFDGNLWAFAHTPPAVLGTLKSLDDFRCRLARKCASQHPDLKDIYEAKIQNMGNALAEVNDKEKVSQCEACLNKLFDTAESRLALPTSDQAKDAQAAAAAADQSASESGTGRSEYLAGPAYSIADAMFAPILYRVTSLGAHKELIAPRPALAAYMRRVRQRPSWNAAFGEGASTWGKLSWFLPALIKSKLRMALCRV